MEDLSDKYIREHSSLPGEVLSWVERQTHIRTSYARMLSGPVQGGLLKMLVQLTRAERVLEIGTFTGYSSICLAYGLSENGRLDTIELNDELEDLIIEGFERAGLKDKISLHIGDAKEILLDLKDNVYDLVFIDANKREYSDYYNLVIDMLKPGGLIIADDVLWDGKIFDERLLKDSQSKGIASFNNMAVSDPRVDVLILPIRHGLSLIRKK